MRRAQHLSTCPRKFAGDPLAVAGVGRRSPVGRARDLQRHQRPLVQHLQKESFVEMSRLLRADIFLDGDASLLDHLETLAGDTRIRIRNRADDARDASRDQRLGARRRLAVMRARLKGYVERRSPRFFPGARKRQRLGMRRRWRRVSWWDNRPDSVQ